MQDINLPVWVVNLKKDEDRRNFMVSQLERLGISYELIEAVEGSKLTEEDFKLYSPELAQATIYKQLIPNEIGCALSHLRLWERMIREDIAEALILEDDALIAEAMLGVLSNRDKLPDDWEHINFTSFARVQTFGPFIFDIYRAAKFKERPFSTVAYLLTRTGAEKLVAGVYPICRPIDHYFWALGINTFGVEPQVASLMDFGSSIGSKPKEVKPRPKFLIRKRREFIEVIRSILIFCGVRAEWIVAINRKLRNFIGSLLSKPE